jgi:isoquinoline 1-oxidoreductase subunit beta
MSAHDGDRAVLARREFVKWGAFSGAVLLLGVSRGSAVVSFHTEAEKAKEFTPNQWLRIDAAGMVVVFAAHSEMGQGVRTSLPMIVAEELGADWSKVTVMHARPGPSFRDMRTSGSGSVSDSWTDLRHAAATARELLISAARLEWNAPDADCFTEGASVVNRATSQRLSFGALVERASRLPVPPTITMKPSSAYRLLGTRVTRVDAPLFTDGRAAFGLDARPHGVAVACVARPPQHGAVAGTMSDAAARAMPGVMKVVRVPTGIAVIADRTWNAMRARDALVIAWVEQPADELNTAAYRASLDAVVDHGKKSRREGSNVEAALENAATRLDATYHTPFQGHAAMEPLNCVADVRDGRCDIWVGTQAPNQAQEHVARLLGIPLDDVVINVTLLGGGFGRRLDIDYVLEAVEVSRAAQMPVQVVWTREDDMRHDRYHPAAVNRITAGLDASGKVIAWRQRAADYHLTMFGAYDPAYDPAADEIPWGGYDTPYVIPSLDVTLAVLESPVPSGAWRSVGYPATVLARECFLDEIAHATGRDPIALRLELIPSPGNINRSSGTRANGDRLRRVLQLAADRAGWGSPLAPTSDGRRWGRGIACNAYHGQTMVAQVAEVSVGREGDVRVHRVVCAVDCGRVINRSGLESQFESGVAWALSAVLKGSITFARGRTQQGNFNDFPVLRMNEMPAVEVHVVESALPPFGVGEPPVPAVAPAVLNAVFAATGTRLRELPITAFFSSLRSTSRSE